MKRIIDISEPVSTTTAVWPGDTRFSARRVMSMADGCSCNVSTITMSLHCGSHADAPLHFDRGGAPIDRVPLDSYMGRCRVVEIVPSGQPPTVPASGLAAAALEGVERVLLRTSTAHDEDRFDVGFCSLGLEAARWVVAHGMRLVGIDTPSMDHFSSKDLPAHRALLAGGVAILENLDLSKVEPGEYELIALPLKLVGADSAPVRAVLREL